MLDFIAKGFLVKILQTLLAVKLVSILTGNHWQMMTRLRFACGGILMCLGIMGIEKLRDMKRFRDQENRYIQARNQHKSSEKFQRSSSPRASSLIETKSRKPQKSFSSPRHGRKKALSLPARPLIDPPKNNKTATFNSSIDLETLAKILNFLPEGVVAVDLKGEVRFMNNYMCNILDFNEKVTLQELSTSLSDFKFREASIQANNSLALLKEVSILTDKSALNNRPSVQDSKIKLSRTDFLHKIEGITSLESLFISCITDPDAQEATERYVPTFQTRYHHPHNDTWYSIEIKVHLLSENLHEKYFIILLRDTTERDHRIISLEKEKILYRDNLIASFSHELRTPLNANLAFIEQSLESPDIPEHVKKNLLKPAFDSGRLLFYMVSDILDFSLIILNKLRLDVKARDIKRTVHDCLELFQNKVRQKGISLKLKFHQDVPRVLHTDHQRMSQVLTNLLSNAVQFTLKGEVEVIVSKLANNNIMITVTDTGIGMDENVIRKLERKLSNEMLKEKLSEASVGIGLGLYIANKLAKVLNPQKETGIEFVSEAQVGSKFFFEIENKEPKRLDTIKSEILHRGGSDFLGIDEKCDLMHRLKNYNSHSMKNLFRLSKKAISEGSQARVLIVDDEIFNITVIENFCKSLGIATEKAFNGKEAINKLKLCTNDSQVPIKLVFMDVNMPVMDGYEATISIMNLIEVGEIDDTMVVGLTAYVSRDMIDKCYECGMAEVVNKPISKETLIEVLVRYKVLRSERNSIGREGSLGSPGSPGH